MTPDEVLRQALRDLLRETSPTAALLTYCKGTRWPILPPNGPAHSIYKREPATGVAPTATRH